MTPIKRLPEKVVRSWFWKQVDAFNNPECFAPGTFNRSQYEELYAVMYDRGWLSDHDLEMLDYLGLP